MATRRTVDKKIDERPTHPWAKQISKTNSALTRAAESIRGFPSIPVLDGFSDVSGSLAE